MRRLRVIAVGLLVAACAGAAAAPPAGAATRPVTGIRVVRLAKHFTGVPYVFGANGPRSFDCSGFTSYVYRRLGYTLPRSSYAQMRAGHAVRGRLQLGDLVFWEGGGHVGIYTGHSRFISATVHRGIWDYSFATWRSTQPYTTARRILASRPAPPRVRASAADAGLRRNGGPADATPAR